MSLIVDGTTGVTFNDSSLQGAAASPYVLKNRIINGDMRIDQRNAGASITPTTGVYALDRWYMGMTQSSKFSVQQNAGSVTPPAGFTNYIGITSLSAYSVAAGDTFYFKQTIEGFNTADLAWGTANAKTITISFWVRSSLTGTFSGAIFNDAGNRCYPYSYTISAANTWEQKTVTIVGDTTGTWNTNNSGGVILLFNIGTGSTYLGTAGSWGSTAYNGVTGSQSVVGTNGATFYITGVQLEIGTSATPFERRLYNQELANCQRYYWKWTSSQFSRVALGYSDTTTNTVVLLYLPCQMRTTPTSSITNMTVNGTSITSSAVVSYDANVAYLNCTASGRTANTMYQIYTAASSTGIMELSSEL